MTPQRTPEWHSARVSRITGSRIGAILGLSPYQSRDDVLRDMVRGFHGLASEFSGNIATEYGTKNEATAVATFELTTGLDVAETGFHAYEDWAGASPDGLIGSDAVLEVKCPFKAIKKTLAEQPHYYAQLQWEMLCTGRKKAYFYQWQPDDDTLNIVHQDKDWLDHAMPEARQFHAFYLSELGNPEHLEPLRVELNTQEACALIHEWDDMKEARDRADERMKDITARLAELTNGKNGLIDGRKFTMVRKDGAVSYARVVKDLLPGVDLEKYRGKPSEGWRLT